MRPKAWPRPPLLGESARTPKSLSAKSENRPTGNAPVAVAEALTRNSGPKVKGGGRWKWGGCYEAGWKDRHDFCCADSLLGHRGMRRRWHREQLAAYCIDHHFAICGDSVQQWETRLHGDGHRNRQHSRKVERPGGSRGRLDYQRWRLYRSPSGWPLPR